jgi:hypothetical protein
MTDYTNAQHIADLEMAEERGYARGKAAIIKAAELWCNQPADSAVFHPNQKITKGITQSAIKLLDYLKK